VKTKVLLVVVALSVLWLSGCTRVEAGHVGLEIKLAGTQRGVQDIPIRTGWVFYNPLGTTIIEYPTYVQTATWTKDSDEIHEGSSTNNERLYFTSKDQLNLGGDFSLSYSIQADKAAHFYVTFRTEDLKTFTHGYMKNVVRDSVNSAASQFTAEEINGPRKEEFLAMGRKIISDEMAKFGVQIVQFGLTGQPELPPQLQNAIVAKNTAVQLAQQAENELRKTQAEAAKQVAQAEGEAKAKVAYAEGEAKANATLANSVTDRLLTLRKLDIQQEAVRKWNGSVPQIQGGGSASGSLNIIVPIKE
jgi:regulator of protease activity HflC (stomatin/prohibitin superfamily)